MDFSLEQVKSPLFPLPLFIGGERWTSVAEYAYAQALATPERREAMRDFLRANNDTPRPWLGLDVEARFRRLLTEELEDRFLVEADAYWTLLFSRDVSLVRRLLDTGSATLETPLFPRMAETLMMHRLHLGSSGEEVRESARLLALLRRDFFLRPRMPVARRLDLEARYRDQEPPPDVPLPVLDPLLVDPDRMVEGLRKRHYPELRESQLREFHRFVARFVLARAERSTGRSIERARADLSRLTDEEAETLGAELADRLAHTLPDDVRAAIEARRAEVLTEEDVAGALEEDRPHDLVAVPPSLLRRAQARYPVVLTEHDPLLPPPEAMRSMMETVLRTSAHRPALSSWEEGFGVYHEQAAVLFRRAFDVASDQKWSTPSLRTFLARDPAKKFSSASAFPWAGHLVDFSLADRHRAFASPSAQSWRRFASAPASWNTPSFLADPFLRAFLRLKASYLAAVARLYFPRDAMRRRLSPLMPSFRSERALFAALFGPLSAATPDPDVLAYIARFTVGGGVDAGAVFGVLDSFLSRVVPADETVAGWCAAIVEAFFRLGKTRYLDHLAQEVGIDFLRRHPFMIPAFTLRVPPDGRLLAGAPEPWSSFDFVAFWRSARPHVRAFLLCHAFAENGTLVQSLKDNPHFETMTSLL